VSVALRKNGPYEDFMERSYTIVTSLLLQLLSGVGTMRADSDSNQSFLLSNPDQSMFFYLWAV